jgi:exosortase
MTTAAISRRRVLRLSLILVPFALAYAPVCAGLVSQWADDPNYAHGFFVVPMAAWLAWHRYHRYAATPTSPSAAGIALLLVGAVLYAFGTAAAELFTTRVSMVVVVAGLVAALEGRARLRALAFPVVFLICMIPLPYLFYYQLTFPLQIESSRLAAALLSAAGMPVVREGNILELEGYTLEVVTACSGLRSIMTLGTMALFMTDVLPLSRLSKGCLVAAALPVAVGANVARLATTACVAAVGGAAAAESFLHELSGLVVFLTGLVALFAIGKGLAWVEHKRR